jgi:hypothetical protein
MIARAMPRRRASGWHTFLLLAVALIACATHRAEATETAAQLDAVSIVEDPGATMSADQVAARLAAAPTGTSASAARPSFNIEFSRSAWWVAATLVNHDSVERPLVLAIRDARLDHADFYVERSGAWTLAGRFPAGLRDADHPASRYPTLDTTLRPGERMPVLIRITSRKEMRLAPSVFTPTAWHAYELRAAMWNFGFFGGLLALVWCALLIGARRCSKRRTAAIP